MTTQHERERPVLTGGQRVLSIVYIVLGLLLAGSMLWAIAATYGRDTLGGTAALQFWTIATLWTVLVMGLLFVAIGVRQLRTGRKSGPLLIALAVAFVATVVGSSQIGSKNEETRGVTATT